MKKLKKLLLAASLTTATLNAIQVFGADGTWTVNAGGSWADPSRWAGGIIANGVDATADFSTVNITANRTVTLDGDVTIGHLIAGDTTQQQDWILSAGTADVLTLAVSSGMPTFSTPGNGDAFIFIIDVDIQGTQGLMIIGDDDGNSGRFRFRGLPKSYSGDTILTNGAKLHLANDPFGPGGAIPDGPGKGDLYIWNGPGPSTSRFIINAVDETVNGLWGNGQVDKNNDTLNTLTVGNNGASSEFSGSLSDNARAPFHIRKIGNGTFTFNGAANGFYTGTMIADGGTLVVGPNALIPPGSTLAGGAGLLDLSSANLTATSGFSIGGDGPVILPPLTLNGISLSPGVDSTPGTLILSNSVTCSFFSTNIFHLASETAVGGGVNDLIIINGNFDLANQILNVRFRFLDTLPATNGSYTIIKYTGSLLNGSAASFAAQMPAFIDNATFDTSVPNEIRVSFNYTLSNRDVVWNAPYTGNWDEGMSFSWLFGGNPVSFVSGDRAWFTNGPAMGPTNEIYISEAVLPGGVTVGGTNDYVFSGPGYLVGGNDLVKTGTGSLSISNAQRFEGTTYINEGILRVYDTAALGRTNGPTIISPGGTLDLNANLEEEPIFAAGDGFNGLGAITRTDVSIDNSLRNVTLTGDATFAVPNDRWDIQAEAVGDIALNAAGHKVTKTGPGLLAIAGISSSTNVIETDLGDLEVTEGIQLLAWGITLGQPDKNIIVHSNATVRFNNTGMVGASGTNILFKNLFLTNATCHSQSSSDTFEFPVYFGGNIDVNGECIFQTTSPHGNFIFGPISGPGSVLKTGGQPVVFTASNSFAGPLIITQNKVTLANPDGLCLTSPSIVIEATNGNAYLDIQFDEQIPDYTVVTITNALSGNGRFALKGFNETIAGLQGARGGSGPDDIYLQSGVGDDGDSNLVSTLTLLVPETETFDFGGVIRDQAGPATNCVLHIIKDGPGTQIFSDTVSHTGTTTVKNGTLALDADTADGSPIVLQGGTLQLSGPAAVLLRTNSITGSGSLVKDGNVSIDLQGTASFTGPTLIKAGLLAANGTLGSGTSSVTVESGGVLGGSGTISDPVTILAGGTLAPGNSVGSLSIGSLVLQDGSTTIMELDKFSPIIQIPDQVIGLDSITYGGTLQVLDVTTAYPIALGDEFRLFSSTSYSGSFTNIILPTLASGLGWTNTLTTDGYIRVVAAEPSTPAEITWTLGPGEITFSWPAAYTGWVLQAQTNQISVGLSNNWVTLPGSDQTNAVTVQVDAANPAVFYRLSDQP